MRHYKKKRCNFDTKKVMEIVRIVFNCFYEMFIYFIFLWGGALAIMFTYLLPEQGVTVLVGAILLVWIPRIYEKIKYAKGE